MCGIAGWVDWQKNLSDAGDIVGKMSDTLQRRGPDAQGIWLSPRAAFAHRRLIVIDPESGQQPMRAERDGKTNVITFNGEIYNYRELKLELEKLGHRFRSHSDTEVLLHSYLQWGDDCVTHLNGIFAFAIWDEAAQKLLLARDPLGVKPLFFAERGNSIIFGSELKALLAHPLVEPEMDNRGLAQILNLAFFHEPGSGFYKNIGEVRGGHRITFRKDEKKVHRYWELKSAPHTDDLKTTIETIRSLLTDTIRRQLVADVPVVSMLSGGLDSSGVSALAALEFEKNGRKLNTYSLDFENHAKHFRPDMMHLSHDLPYALKVAEKSKTTQHTITLGPQALLDNLLVPLLAHDVPAMGQMEASLYLLFKEMKKDATVALSGESADEVFGGYPWFFDEKAISVPTFPWMALLSGKTTTESSVFSADLMARVKPHEYIAENYATAMAEVPRLAGESTFDARRREVFFFNITRFLPLLLDRKDRMSMATGFEVRVPFCDHRLVQYVWNIPWSMKTTGNIEKGVLREAFGSVLPEEVRMRRKSPYPASQDPAYVAGVRQWAKDILHDPNAPVLSMLNRPALEKILNEDPSGPALFALAPMERIIQINAWLKDYRVRIVA